MMKTATGGPHHIWMKALRYGITHHRVEAGRFSCSHENLPA